MDVDAGTGAASSDGAVPPWGTPSPEHVVDDADQVADAVDDPHVAPWGTPSKDLLVGDAHWVADAVVGPVWGMPDQYPDDTAPGRYTGLAATSVMSTASQVDEVCRWIAAGGWTAGSSAWLSGYTWQVLGVADGAALLLADHVVCEGPYNRGLGVTWERCDLRRWLNDEFCRLLGEPLVSRVLEASVPNDPNPVWGTHGGEDTQDRFFLLSMKEAAVYFTGEDSITCEDGGNRIFRLGDRGKATDSQGKSAWWWLRSPGHETTHAAYVYHDGNLDVLGYPVSVSCGVRPAFWLNLRS
ncbi:MAG: DUF6273 domain-containing protein [Micrococcales bacterium]|nr:DUF6273 domain-containing protein [Micrococcales bacterium]